MTLITRTTWALLLALTLATVLLVPRDLDYTFPAESTAQVIITDTGVSPDELLSLAEQHGVEVAQLRMTTDTTGQVGEPLATDVIEVLGYGPDDYIRPPLTPVFSEAPIVYAGSPAQDSALGAWNVTGSQTRVRHFLDAVRAQWSDAIWKSDALVPGRATEAMRQSALGRALLLALLTHTLVTASAVLARPAPFRHSLLSGRPRARLLIRLLRLGLVRVGTWVLAPLGALGLIMAYDVHASALLSVHRLMAELIVVAALAALTATVIGTTLGWAVLARTSRGRAVGSSVLAPRARMVPVALICGAALTMTWSFASSSDAVVTDIVQDQALRHQAQAQDSLPASYSLSIRTASESAYNNLMPRIDSFIKDEEATGSLVLAWAVPDDTTPDAGGPRPCTSTTPPPPTTAWRTSVPPSSRSTGIGTAPRTTRPSRHGSAGTPPLRPNSAAVRPRPRSPSTTWHRPPGTCPSHCPPSVSSSAAPGRARVTASSSSCPTATSHPRTTCPHCRRAPPLSPPPPRRSCWRTSAPIISPVSSGGSTPSEAAAPPPSVRARTGSSSTPWSWWPPARPRS